MKIKRVLTVLFLISVSVSLSSCWLLVGAAGGAAGAYMVK